LLSDRTASMLAALASPCRIKRNHRRRRRIASGRAVYAYVLGRPISSTDPYGYQDEQAYDLLVYRGGYHDLLVGKLAAGMRVCGAQVVTEANLCMGSICTRVDILGRDPAGKLFAMEVKTGDRPGFTPNQLAVYPHLRAGGLVIATDPKVSGLQLVPGAPLPPINGVLLYQQDSSSPPLVGPFP
jgi:hypothetical protein